MKLIDADKVNETIDRFIGYLDEDMILRIKMKISKIPTVDRPHGEWTEHRRYNPIGCFYSAYECSNCRDELWQMTEWQFCPNCGADMRKKAKENE